MTYDDGYAGDDDDDHGDDDDDDDVQRSSYVHPDDVRFYTSDTSE